MHLYDVAALRVTDNYTKNVVYCTTMFCAKFVTENKENLTYNFFQCHHMSLMDFVVSPPGCGRSVTDV
jgi:hypothetical protein